MPPGTPPTSVPEGSVVMSGSPSAIGSTSRHSSDRVACSAFNMPWISCSSSSSTRGLCLVLRSDAPANWPPDSVTVPPVVSGPGVPGRLLSVLLAGRGMEGTGAGDGGAAALLALHLVLRVVLTGPHGAA